MTDEPTCPTPLRTQVHLARSVAENLRPADLAAELIVADVVLIDVREPHEAALGIIEGAVVIPRGTIEFAVGFCAGRRTVVYCSTGDRSALVVRTLYGLGHHDVAHLAGGVEAWLRDGRVLVPWSAVEEAGQQPVHRG